MLCTVHDSYVYSMAHATIAFLESGPSVDRSAQLKRLKVHQETWNPETDLECEKEECAESAYKKNSPWEFPLALAGITSPKVLKIAQDPQQHS